MRIKAITSLLPAYLLTCLLAYLLTCLPAYLRLLITETLITETPIEKTLISYQPHPFRLSEASHNQLDFANC